MPWTLEKPIVFTLARLCRPRLLQEGMQATPVMAV